MFVVMLVSGVLGLGRVELGTRDARRDLVVVMLAVAAVVAVAC